MFITREERLHNAQQESHSRASRCCSDALIHKLNRDWCAYRASCLEAAAHYRNAGLATNAAYWQRAGGSVVLLVAA